MVQVFLSTVIIIDVFSTLNLLCPADLNYDPVAAEERLNQEASELEKRLSMISQCSLASSTGASISAASVSVPNVLPTFPLSCIGR